jgi:Tol biopolymer transport system component
MGDVYRARDTRLGREVAIKVLPESVARDPERLARFEREARSLASLNHPNIAQIYGVEDSAAGGALVMELIPGQDLRERMDAGPMAPSEALAIARQIAAGLEAAHEAGIVHRDLKPANIQVRDDGVVKVLDFGLAKALSPSGSDPGSQASDATVTAVDMTQRGIVLGTAAYMSPEQARGRDVDKRTDIWAFGVVLHELLSGQRLFAGDTIPDTIAAVLTRTIDLDLLPASTPPHVRTLIARCLERDPKSRLRDIGEARIALSDAGEVVPDVTTIPRAGRRAGGGASTFRQTAALVIAALGLGAAGAWLWQRPRTPVASVSRGFQFDLQAPPGTELRLSLRPAFNISADGELIALSAERDGVSRLYLRRRGEVEMKEIPGTQGMSDPVFSPDGNWLTAVSEGELRKLSLDGSASVVLTDARSVRGTAWLGNDTVVFATPAGQGLRRVSASGRDAQVLTELDRSRGERTHRWPAVVPGGKAVLFTVGTAASPDDYNDSQIDAVVVSTGERRKVLDGASMVRCTADGRLIYAKLGVLYGVKFDSDRLQVVGEPETLVTGVEGDGTTGAAHFSIAADGTLLFVPGLGATNRRRLVWMDRNGTVEPVGMDPAHYSDPDVSPNGQHIAVVIGPSGRGDVWTYDIGRKQTTRVTFDANAATPRWSSDSRSIYFTSMDASAATTTIRRVELNTGGTGAVLATLPGRAYFGSIATDASFTVVAHLPHQNGLADLVRLPLRPIASPVQPQQITTTPQTEIGPTLSLDNRFLLYTTAAGGQPNVYVRDINGPGLWQISTTGGADARWSADGREIYYRANNQQMAVPVELSPVFRPGLARVLLADVPSWFTESGTNFAVNPVTGKFLLIQPPADAAGSTTPATIRVVMTR